MLFLIPQDNLVISIQMNFIGETEEYHWCIHRFSKFLYEFADHKIFLKMSFHCCYYSTYGQHFEDLAMEQYHPHFHILARALRQNCHQMCNEMQFEYLCLSRINEQYLLLEEGD